MPTGPERGVSRRELLKLSPVLLLSGFAVPSLREYLLGAGVAWSDAVADLLFRRGHLASTFSDADVVPFEEFPYNGYGEMEPEIDFAAWTLKVGGAVEVGCKRISAPSTDQASYRLTVKDNGIGMAPELVARVFDLFAQAERTSDRAQGGLGLGLALVNRFLELHDGWVEIESTMGSGTLVRCHLPRRIHAGDEPPTESSDKKTAYL